jgi:4'-phosphopantetheinyl transferase
MHPSSLPHEAHVWLLPDPEPASPAQLAGLAAILDEEERARAARYLRPEDRVRSIAARALLRLMLSRYAPVAPSAWQFVTNRYGRPELVHVPAEAGDLRFNVSHTDGLVAVAVARGRDIGVDVEHIDRPLTHDIAGRFFSPAEVRDLRRASPDEQPRVFFDYWTLKESYIKARGMGLALPLAHFSFHLRPDQPPAISFAPPLDDDPARWQFAQAWPSARHRLAVAVERHGADLPVRIAALPIEHLVR